MEHNDPILRLENVHRGFRDGTQALSGVTFTIKRGSFVLLLGANGSGKSVLLRIISGLMAPGEGEVLLEEKPLASHGKELHRKIGFIFQNPDSQIIGQTVEEDTAFGPRNIGLAEREVAARTEAALALTGLLSHRRKRPHLLSGGEKRRLAIAGVEAMEPDILLLDEPFSNLDYPATVEFLRLLVRLHERGKTVILVTHDIQKVAAHAERIILLSEGRIAADGSVETAVRQLERFGVRAPHHGLSIAECSWLEPGVKGEAKDA
jgi:biotin transport system ATP-binding protein